MAEEKALAPYRGNQIINSFDDAARAANAMAKSGYFLDARDASQAVVKILAGQEMGFGPFAAMNGIHIIKGKPGVGANLQAAAVKSSGKYDYKVRELSDTACRIEFFQAKESIGISVFTIEDARKAGTQNLEKFPRNMLFARAMSNGVKWYCPDVFNGSTVYTPEELGATVDGDGDVIDVPVTEAPPEPEPQKTELPANAMTLDEALKFTTSDKRPLSELTWEELEEQQLKAERVSPDKRGEKYWKAVTALELVMEHREAENDAAREAENE